jgi:RimJ/RimL family protein N-acetyltransferase
MMRFEDEGSLARRAGYASKAEGLTMHEDLAPRRALSGAPVAALPSGIHPGCRHHQGETVILEPLDPREHAADLFELSHGEHGSPAIWDYLPYGPFDSLDAFRVWLRSCASTADPMFFVIRDLASRRAAGMASYLNIHPLQGTIEIGHIWFAPLIQNTRQSTEALYLMMRHVMDDLGYRRLEWKCNALNKGSRRAANRLGFRFEGIFYNHVIVKGANRDTAWYSIIDSEWPEVRAGFERWLAPSNFDPAGRQLRSLRELRE